MNQIPIEIDITLVSRLIAAQFPQWKDLPIKPVALGGHDNRTFHLGKEMLVRLPSSESYAEKVPLEQKWLPLLAPSLPVAIPKPLALGQPGEGYPWNWSIYRWIEGETAAEATISDLNSFAADLTQFLLALHRIDPTDGPLPGKHNFFRGGNLDTYTSQTLEALNLLKGKIDTEKCHKLWDAAVKTSWNQSSVWVHGDLSPGNILIKDGKLCAVIDFGGLAVGDPACDLVITWTFFEGKSRETFQKALPFDEGMWQRARAWALWKALIVAAGIVKTNASECANPWHTIEEVLNN